MVTYVTSQGHNQKDSFLCWCFVIVTCLHSAILQLLKKLNVPESKREELKNKMSEDHLRTVNQICFMVVPKSAKLTGDTAGAEQGYALKDAFKKIAYPTALKVKLYPDITL